MQIDILSLFPSVFGSYLEDTPFWYAIQQDIVRVRVHNFCQWVDQGQVVAEPRKTRRGETMVINSEPVAACVNTLRCPDRNSRVVLLSPRGRILNQETARELSHAEHLILICGRLGGFEDGLAELVGAEELSVGDYVLNCGEVAAMVVMDAVVRLVPGVLDLRPGMSDSSDSRPVEPTTEAAHLTH
ncbi:MAG: tRNA (guanosine(37)-N1)-methyltransferase TrmD [Planctomycetaceae bacterium]|nr:tRNA (guanosine(37)-N1)-methyltransferase TrmD [Planctomycetaceae bacterium]